MKNQDYKTHVRMHPLYHYILTIILFAALVLSIINVVRSLNAEENILQSILIFIMVVNVGIIAALVRLYPLKVQDRAIRAEENLRHFVLTGNLLDPRLSMAQITALRFADEKEFPALCDRAVQENMKPDDIKKTIVNWKADHDRV
jgi:hypothetical protein